MLMSMYPSADTKDLRPGNPGLAGLGSVLESCLALSMRRLSARREGVIAMMDGGWMMGWLWLWPVLVLAGLILVAFVAVRLMQGGSASSTGADSAGTAARRILDERFARGEIDEDEYRRRRDALLR
jgi:putative membrane protein